LRAGQPQLPLLNAVGTWLGQQVQAAMKSESQPGGRLAGLLNVATPSGRKLQQVTCLVFDLFDIWHSCSFVCF
jgi:hypothetical protein